MTDAFPLAPSCGRLAYFTLLFWHVFPPSGARHSFLSWNRPPQSPCVLHQRRRPPPHSLAHVPTRLARAAPRRHATAGGVRSLLPPHREYWGGSGPEPRRPPSCLHSRRPYSRPSHLWRHRRRPGRRRRCHLAQPPPQPADPADCHRHSGVVGRARDRHPNGGGWRTRQPHRRRRRTLSTRWHPLRRRRRRSSRHHLHW